jgi:hypothetical protein
MHFQWHQNEREKKTETISRISRSPFFLLHSNKLTLSPRRAGDDAEDTLGSAPARRGARAATGARRRRMSAEEAGAAATATVAAAAEEEFISFRLLCCLFLFRRSDWPC